MPRLFLTLVLSCLTMITLAAEPPEKTAHAFLDKLDAGDYAAAETMLDARMAAALPVEKLKAVWESLPQQMGTPKGRGETRTASAQGMPVVVTRLEYAQGALLAQIAVDADDKIASLFFRPAPVATAAPAVPADANFSEIDFAVGNLPGTLTLPNGTGKFPAVVLVHGSGTQDRDEAIGPNKPFLDIAHGLAAQGIAVLRYDKRTKARPQDLASRDDYTMDDETTDDAVIAIAELAGDPRIDDKRIFVFGHSQGAMLAPRILAESGKAAGAVMLAAPARRILDVLSEQIHRQFAADGSVSAEEQKQLDQLSQKIAIIRGKDELTSADTLLGAYMHYWRMFDAVDPVADAKSSKQPLLLLQGERDIQVTAPDWQLWQQAFADSERVTIKHYPALSHIGIVGEGTPADYTTPGHVDTQLIDDAAAWIKAH